MGPRGIFIDDEDHFDAAKVVAFDGKGDRFCLALLARLVSRHNLSEEK